MNNLFKFILTLFAVLYFSGCSSEMEDGIDNETSIDKEMIETTQVNEVIQNTSAINPPQLPSVSETPAVELKH